MLTILTGLRSGQRPAGKSDRTFAVVVNGPSLKDVPLERLRTHDTIVAGNHLAETDFYTSLQPTLYVLQDSYFWKQNLADTWIEKREALYDALNQKTTWPVTLYVPHYADVEFLSKRLHNTYIFITPYHAGHLKKLNSPSVSYLRKNRTLYFLWAHNICAPPPKNLVVGASYVCFLLGAKKIFIYGADMSFFKSIEVDQHTNRVGIYRTHFYGSEFSYLYKNKKNTQLSTVSQELHFWSQVFYSFEVMDDFFRRNNTRVYNCSPTSYIDAFERIPENLST